MKIGTEPQSYLQSPAWLHNNLSFKYMHLRQVHAQNLTLFVLVVWLQEIQNMIFFFFALVSTKKGVLATEHV